MFFLEDGDIEITEEERDVYRELREKYNEAEKTASLRNSISERRETLERIIRETDELLPQLKSEKLMVIARLVKGTALLRKAHVLDIGFESSEQYYQDAYILLGEKIKTDDEKDYNLLNQLLLLNFSKCLRNMGINGHRSDYQYALDNFKKLKKNIEKCSNKEKMERWETCLWLEAKINNGIIHKYIYQMEKAKADLGEVINLLLKKNVANRDMIWNRLQENEMLKKIINNDIKDEFCQNIDKFSDDNIKYEGYMQQVLVEMGTVFLKERYLEAAKTLFITTYKLESNNIDAWNNIGVYLRKRNRPGDFEKAIKIFQKHANRKNRFAEINIYKCKIGMLEKKTIEEEKVGKEIQEDEDINAILEKCKDIKIDKILKKNIREELEISAQSKPNDLEIKLLLGMCYRIEGKWEDALDKFQEIYNKYPYIYKGTIGLKAFFNIIQYDIEKKEFYQAKAKLETIRAECEKDIGRDQMDFLTEMDMGWCLLNIGYYEGAKKCYEKILEHEKNKKEQDSKYETKVKNVIRANTDLGLCYLYLDKIEEACAQFEKVIAIENKNYEANLCLAQCYKALAEKNEKMGMTEETRINLQKAIAKYEMIESIEIDKDDESRKEKIRNELLMLKIKICKERNEEDRERRGSIEKELRNVEKTHPVEICLEFAKYIEKATENEKDILYKSFGSIRIKPNDDLHIMFGQFLKKDSFRRLSAKTRGKMFAKMLMIYEQIQEIKKICHYSIGKASPIHYTTLKTLKILLGGNCQKENKDNKTPKLRLWNTVYMNDSYEGEAFIDLLKEVSEDMREAEGGIKEDAEKVLSKYFKHLDNSSERMVPINGNVYIISFSTRKDSIPMWNAYAEDAKGCYIEFEDDFFDNRSGRDAYKDIFSPSSYPLYKVIYLNSKEEMKAVDGDKMGNENSELVAIKGHLRKIWELLRRLEGFWASDSEKDSNLREEIKEESREFIADCLSEIRFLFKYSEYSHEEEVRLIKCSNSPQLDTENFSIPRLYIEADSDIKKMTEVCLGKKINQGDINQIVSWLYATKKVENVTVSSRHYQ